MAAIRARETKRRGTVWDVDYYDEGGKRRWVTCRTEGEAQRLAGEKERRPGGDPRVTVAEAVDSWLTISRPRVRPQTLLAYFAFARAHVLPEIGAIKVVKLTRGFLRERAAAMLNRGKSHSHVRMWLKLVSAILNVALEQSIIPGNPASGLHSQFRAPRDREKKKALTFEELEWLLDAAKNYSEAFPVVFLLSRTGLRLGEALALRWEDVDFEKRELTVSRTLNHGPEKIGPPKGGRSRTVEIGQSLLELLRAGDVAVKKLRLQEGWRETPPWVFVTRRGKRMDGSHFERTFRRIRDAAGLEPHITPHSLRHTYATLHLQRGADMVWLQQQLGHSSIKMTVDLYGSWEPVKRPGAADALDRVEEA